MSDGTTLDAGSGGDTIYTDEVSGGSANGMKVQGVKIGTGANGTWTELDATSGSLNTLDDNSAAFLAAVQAIQAAVEGTVSVDDNAGSLTVDDGGSSLTVDGTVAISGTVAVTDNSSTLSVDDGGGSLTVDGTVAATQSGTWTVGNASGASAVNIQDGGNSITVDGTVTANAGTGPWPITDNSGSITVDNGGTFAVQSAQSGTWTVQPGNTANTTAWKVDASSVAVPVTDNSGSLTVDNAGTFAVQDSQVVADNAGFTDGTTKVFVTGFIYDEVAGTALTENDAAAARINVNRAQVGIIEDGATRGRYATVSASNALKVDGSAVTQPVSLTAITTSVTPGTSAAHLGKAEDAAHASGDTGVMALGVRSDTPASTAGTTGDYQPMITNSTGAQWVSLDGSTTNSTTAYGLISAASTNATSVKASAGVVYSIAVFNANAAARWFKMYNKASAPTVGTDTPVFRALIPAGGGFVLQLPVGKKFGTGIAFALTTGAADSDTGAVAANELTVNLDYV